MLARIGRAVRAAPPTVPVALGWLIVVVYAFPGQMSADAFAYLRQARSPFFSDRYPSAISALWRLLEFVVAGPTGMFVLQSALIVLGVHAILRCALSPRAAGWTTAAIAVFPPVLVSIAAISTHAMTAALLAIGAGTLACSATRRAKFVALAALAGATAITPNALLATLPIVVLLLRLDGARPTLRALGAWLAITIVVLGGVLLFAQQRRHAWNSALASGDIAGTLACLDDDVPDAPLRSALAGTAPRVDHDLQATARALYDPADAQRAVAALWSFPADGNAPPAAQRDAFAHAARAIVLAHPLAYVRHRLSVFAALLWIDGRDPDAAVPTRALTDAADTAALKAGVPTYSSDAQDDATCVLHALAACTPLFAPCLYLVLAIVLLPFARRDRDVLALLASGIALEATLIVSASTTAYAQSLWLTICACAAIVILVVRRSRS